jgi:(2Fe-2S) ferredoxin
VNKSVHILVCNGKHCRKEENKNVFTSIKNEIIHKNLESKVDVYLAKCCDHCGNACVVTVKDDQNTTYKQVTPQIGRDIINQHVVGRKILFEQISEQIKITLVEKIKHKIQKLFREKHKIE